MKTSNGFILLGQLLVFSLCLLLLTSAVLAYTRSLRLYQRSKQLETAMMSAQLSLAQQDTSTKFTVILNHNHPFKEVQVNDDKAIILNLVVFQP